MEEEERARKVIGLSASNKCVVLSEMVSAMAKEIGSENEESAVVKLLEKGAAVHMKGWKLGYFEHRFTYGRCFFCISQTFFSAKEQRNCCEIRFPWEEDQVDARCQRCFGFLPL